MWRLISIPCARTISGHMDRIGPYKAKHSGQVRLGIARQRLQLKVRRCNPLVPVAMFMTVGGWSLMWAQALSLLNLVPIWVPIAAFGLGLALIPLRFLTDRKPAATLSRPRRHSTW
jgi:hypothetical protein